MVFVFDAYTKGLNSLVYCIVMVVRNGYTTSSERVSEGNLLSRDEVAEILKLSPFYRRIPTSEREGAINGVMSLFDSSYKNDANVK